jgi:hypothetical protein
VARAEQVATGALGQVSVFGGAGRFSDPAFVSRRIAEKLDLIRQSADITTEAVRMGC